jgi:hypothetical protein
LNSGQVIAGEIGSGALGYTAIGEQVGMAQRMDQEACFLGLIEPPVARGDVVPDVRCGLAVKSFVLALPP